MPMPDMGRGIIAPANNENIGTGASEMRTLASTAASAIGALEASTDARLHALEQPDPVELGDTHLDTVVTPGIYVCRTSSSAQVALGYPYESVPGTLHVLPWNPVLPRVIAVFYPWSSRAVTKRTSNSDGTWGVWRDFLGNSI